MATRMTCAALGLAILGSAFGAREAHAQLAACSDVLKNPVVLRLGATQEPLLKNVGRKLRMSAEAGAQVNIAYVTSGSCLNVAGVYSGEELSGNLSYIPGPEDPTWTPSKPSPQCSLGAGNKVKLDIGNSNAFVNACPGMPPKPADVQEFSTAVQAYCYGVPTGSTQQAITAEEGYFVFGFGNDSKVTPWTNDKFLYVLPNDRSTHISLMAAVNVPVGKARGTRLAPNEVENAIALSTNPEQTLGLIGVELLDARRDVIKPLAFRAFGQKYAYYPDSALTAGDRANVRNGLYFPWSPTVYLTKAANNVPVNPSVAYLVNVLKGQKVTPDPRFDPLDEVVKVGLVPNCAMKVSRTVEAGDFSLFEPDEPCHCYFENKVGAKNACTKCTDDGPCGGGKCRHGYCEAK